jgi:hypothetical protein
MAVLDEEHEDASARSRRRLPWRAAVGHLPAVLAVGAVLVYGYLSIGYELFYSRLGVDANDVGLSYAGVLARSAGFVVVYLVLTALLAVLTALLAGIVLTKHRRERDQQRGKNPAASRAWRLFVVAVAVLAMLIVNSLRYPSSTQVTPPAMCELAAPWVLSGMEESPTLCCRFRGFSSLRSTQIPRPWNPPVSREMHRPPSGSADVRCCTSAKQTAPSSSTIQPFSRPCTCRPV